MKFALHALKKMQNAIKSAAIDPQVIEPGTSISFVVGDAATWDGAAMDRRPRSGGPSRRHTCLEVEEDIVTVDCGHLMAIEIDLLDSAPSVVPRRHPVRLRDRV